MANFKSRVSVTKVAKEAGVNARVVREYIERGLLPRPLYVGSMGVYDVAILEPLVAQIRDIKGLTERGKAATIFYPDVAPVGKLVLFSEIVREAEVPATFAYRYVDRGILPYPVSFEPILFNEDDADSAISTLKAIFAARRESKNNVLSNLSAQNAKWRVELQTLRRRNQQYEKLIEQIRELSDELPPDVMKRLKKYIKD